ncbi:MAG: TonB-dependent receptor [Mangrovibacterium sp.]
MKKNYEPGGGSIISPSVFKLLIAMKLMLILICGVGLLSSFGKSYSQNTKLSVELNNSSIEDVLSYIEARTEYSFMYDNKKVDIYRKVSINAKDQTVETILDQLFGDEMNYQIVGKHIIITPKDEQSASVVTQQAKTISGRVTDSSGAALPGVTIVVKGTTIGTITDVDGKYNLSNVQSNATLTFSFIGMKTQEVPVTGKTAINVVMAEEAIGIEEVVAVGYGTARKRDVTGAIATVTGESIREYKSGSVLEAMGGKVAGVQITSTDGTPGGGFNIQIRGVGTITGSTNPLYVVDGFQVSDIDYLSNADIENIEILKDASAAAIYGARAANGVVLVTTKSGKAGQSSINYNGSMTYTTMNKYLDVLSPYEFVKLQSEFGEAYQNRYFMPGNDSEGNPYRYQSLEDYKGVKGVDWQKELFKSTWSQKHDLSVQGGNANTKYSFGFSRYDQEGLFNNSGYKKTTARMRLNQKVSNFLDVDASVFYTNTNKTGIIMSSDQGKFGMLKQLLSSRPTGGLNVTDEELLKAVVDPAEEEIVSDGNFTQFNPLAESEAVDREYGNEIWQGNLSLSLKILSNLYLVTKGSYQTNTYRTDIFYREDSREAYREGAGKAYGNTTFGKIVRWSNSNYLTYKYSKNKHRLETMLGEEIVGNSNEYLYGQASDFPFENLGSDNLGIGAKADQVSTSFADKTLVSYFARVNYNYRERYLLTATLRRDGSSVFSEKNKWGWFPSFSGAWRISEENFMKSASVISNLKLRAGYGVVGNDNIASNLSLTLLSAAKYGLGNSLITVLQPKQLANSNLKWEGSATANIGIDLGLFNNRLGLTVDVYKRNSKDLLLAADLGYITGFDSQVRNTGEIQNKGLEITLNSINIENKNGLTWQTDFNISFVRNKLIALNSGQTVIYSNSNFSSDYTGYDYYAEVGHSLGSMYGYVFDGVYQVSDFDLVNDSYVLKEGMTDISAHYGLPVVPGVIKYKNVDGDADNVITTDDRTKIGNGYPTFFGGLTNTLTYKGIDFSFNLQYSYGNDIFNATKLFSSLTREMNRNLMAEVADRWTPENPSNKVPSTKGYIANEVYSKFIEDGSYLRMKSITLGYTLPKKWTKRYLISKFRVYASAQNLFTITNYSGYDPEVSTRTRTTLTPGVDWSAYPRSQVYSFGVDVQF